MPSRVDAYQANQPLPEGTALQKYRILRVLAAGGFSFVYLAHDAKEQPVAIKEYLPSTLALRVNGAAQPQVARGRTWRCSAPA